MVDPLVTLFTVPRQKLQGRILRIVKRTSDSSVFPECKAFVGSGNVETDLEETISTRRELVFSSTLSIHDGHCDKMRTVPATMINHPQQ